MNFVSWGVLTRTVQIQSQDSYAELKCKRSPNLWYCKMSVKSLLKFYFIFLFMQNVILHVKMEEDVHDT